MSQETYKPDSLPESITKELCVSYGIGKYVCGEIRVTEYAPSDSQSDGFESVLLCRKPVTIEIPRQEKDGIRKKAVDVLVGQQEKVRADAQVKISQIQHKIDQLKCLEHHED